MGSQNCPFKGAGRPGILKANGKKVKGKEGQNHRFYNPRNKKESNSQPLSLFQENNQWKNRKQVGSAALVFQIFNVPITEPVKLYLFTSLFQHHSSKKPEKARKKTKVKLWKRPAASLESLMPVGASPVLLNTGVVPPVVVVLGGELVALGVVLVPAALLHKRRRL